MPLQAYHTEVIDSNELSDQDRFFKGMRSRSQSTQLVEGTAQLVQNMRLSNLEASVRLGIAKKTDDLFFPTPITIPFVLPAGPLTNGQSFACYAASVYSDPANDNLEYIVLASTEKATFWNPSTGPVDVAFPDFETIEDEDGADIVQANNSLYIFRGWEGDAQSISTITRSGSTASVTTTSPHTLFTGFRIRVAGAAQSAYNGDFEITVTGASSFSYTVSGAPASPATGTITFRKLNPPLVWDGDFTEDFRVAADTMPNADYGLWQANRMIQPYARSEVVLSDILDPEVVNTVTNQAKFAFGGNDYTVGLHPHQENRLVVFMRKSIHELHGVTGVDLSDAIQDEVTREVGCCARRTIQTAGNKIFWLSDSGVYSIDIADQLNLVGSGFPLSEPIADYFDRVNTLAVDVACSVYHDNRYYIACPLDGATRNNFLFVYNLINQEWESVDTFPSGVYIDYLLVSDFDDQRRVFMCNREGAIYLMEEAETDQTGTVASPTSNGISWKLWSRAHLLTPNNSIKAFQKLTAHLESTGVGDVVRIYGSTRNPDGVQAITTYTALEATDRTVESRVRQRGHSFSMRLEGSTGRPIIRSIAVSGRDYGFSTRSR